MILNILFVIGFILLVSFAYAAHAGAPWVPTHARDLARIKKIADLKAGERFVELGSGNGRVCRYIARHTEVVESLGVELSLAQVILAAVHNRLVRSSATVKLANAFNHNLTDTDVVYMFLMPETYEKIRPKLESELKSGARVVSYVWPIEGWKHVQADEVVGSPTLYLYKR